MTTAPDPVHVAIEFTLRQDRGQLIAALINSVGDFELAEECLQDAVETALQEWPRAGVPKSRRGWLLQVARRKAIDRIRRCASFARNAAQIAVLEQAEATAPADPHDIPDHRLRLIFTCCHPALDEKTREALTLRTLGGLTTEEVARAFLDKTPAMAQRLARARGKISKAGIPFAIPDAEALPERIGSVLQVIYLIFNEGYAATQGQGQLRIDLCEEAIFLARLMVGYCPQNAEVAGLLALMLLSHARRKARDVGGYIPLSEQDRSLWDRGLITQGQEILEAALRKGGIGPYQLQAAISALHCEAEQADQTDWCQIAALYRLLAQMQPGAVVQLNLAVALSFCEGPQTALEMLDGLANTLNRYQPFYAARADVLMRMGQTDLARKALLRAMELTQVQSEQDWLAQRFSGLQ